MVRLLALGREMSILWWALLVLLVTYMSVGLFIFFKMYPSNKIFEDGELEGGLMAAMLWGPMVMMEPDMWKVFFSKKEKTK